MDMPRQARLDAPGTLHHVMIRGIEKANIFRDDKDREHFLSRVGEIAKATGTQILAWVLMDNHVHLLLFSGSSGLPKFMRRLLTGYAVWFNRRHQRAGHLFQNRYKSIICEEDQYLLELVRYIHLNPLRSHVVQNLEELDRYPWSGHSVLIGKVRHDWQEKEYVLNQFGRGQRQSVRAYRKFIEEGKGLGRRPELVGGGLVRSLGGWSKVLSLRNRGEETEHDSRILGGGDFVQAVMRDAEEAIARQVRNRGTKTIEETIRRMCRGSEVSEKELGSGSQRRRVSEVRTEIACYLSREMGISMAEIARRLGVGTSAIAMAIKRRNSESRKM
jgi:REP element-mobilizing transposase RayT